MNYWQWLELATPEVILVVAALAVLLVDLTALRGLDLRLRLRLGALLAGVGCLLAIAWMLALPGAGNLGHGMLVVDPLTRLVKGGLLVLALFAILLTIEADFTVHVGEYYAVLLLATVGMMLLASSADILMIFLSLELTSLSLYILTAFNKAKAAGTEAALKYFLFGGVAAAFTLFGLSLLYGIAGSTSLADIARVAGERAIQVVTTPHGVTTRSLDPLLLAAIVMTVIGFGFKVAVVPFHLWAPDTYQGAPIPAAAFIASGSKLASLFVFAKVMLFGFAGAEGSAAWLAWRPGWFLVLAMLAAASMLWGNLAAIAQRSVRRLLAYSAIAHAGYMLLAVMTRGPDGVASLLYYAFTYGLTAIGAFTVVSVVQGNADEEGLPDFAGLARRAPVVALCMLVFLLSLAGIPPLAGFFAKFYLFSAALRAGPQLSDTLWLIILALATSTVSLYYYLQVLKQIFVMPAPAAVAPREVPLSTRILLLLLAGAVIVLGCAPGLLVNPLLSAATRAGWQ